MKTRARTWRSAASAREDSRKSSGPQVAVDRGSLAHSTDADLAANTMLIQKLHNVAEARQVSHEAPESHAVKCVLETLIRMAWAELLTGDVGSAAQTLVDPVWVGRDERIMAGRSSECTHQSSGAAENDVISCCQRGSGAEPTAKALFRRGLLDAWRACSIGPRSITTCAFGRR